MKYRITAENVGKEMMVTLMIKYHGKKFKYTVNGKNLERIDDAGSDVEKAIKKTFGKKDSKKIINKIVKDFS